VFRRHASLALAIVIALLSGVGAPALAIEATSHDERYFDRDYDLGFPRRDMTRSDEFGEFLSEREISFGLLDLGYAKVEKVRYSERKGYYRAIGYDADGNRYRLSISAYSGRVINREWLEGSQDRDEEYGYDTYYYDRYY
jgi:hypothetical protein